MNLQRRSKGLTAITAQGAEGIRAKPKKHKGFMAKKSNKELLITMRRIFIQAIKVGWIDNKHSKSKVLE